MSDTKVKTKAELLADIQRAWTELWKTLDRLTEAQLTTLKDEAGWTVKDHLAHLVYWERSVISRLQGKSAAEGLGIDPALASSGDYDQQNAVIQQQHQHEPLQQVLADLRSTHTQTMSMLSKLTDADLQKPFRRWRPDESGEGEGPLMIEMIEGNMNGHFDEHVPWILALVAKGS